MTASKKQKHSKLPEDGTNPAWSDGLKRIYDSVVEEPLPDSFKDLLSQLDELDGTGSSSGKSSGAS